MRTVPDYQQLLDWYWSDGYIIVILSRDVFVLEPSLPTRPLREGVTTMTMRIDPGLSDYYRKPLHNSWYNHQRTKA